MKLQNVCLYNAWKYDFYDCFYPWNPRRNQNTFVVVIMIVIHNNNNNTDGKPYQNTFCL